MDFLYSFNYLALLVALVWNVALGMFWYSPKVFFPVWQKAVGLTDEDFKDANPGASMAMNLVAAVVTLWGLAVLVNLLNIRSAGTGAALGALLAVSFVTASEVSNGAFRMTKPLVYIIDGGFRLLFLTGAGALIGAWR